MGDHVRLLRQWLAVTRLSQNDFARWVLGTGDRTLSRWLAGDAIGEDRRNWICRIRAIEFRGDELVITVARGAIGPRWKLREERRKEERESGLSQ